MQKIAIKGRQMGCAACDMAYATGQLQATLGFPMDASTCLEMAGSNDFLRAQIEVVFEAGYNSVNQNTKK